MGSKWSSLLESTRPPDGSTRSVLIGARRVFASSKNTCYLRGRHLCFSHRSHPGRLAPSGLMVEAVSEAFAVCWSHYLGFSCFWRDGIVFVAKHIREKNRCRKRICDVPDHAYLLANKPFLHECFWITPLWEYQDLYLCISPWAGFFVFCNCDRVDSSSEIAQICVFFFYWNVNFVWKFPFSVLAFFPSEGNSELLAKITLKLVLVLWASCYL